jgi:2,4-didehydro-3-deoxy-L-rhamnonate hydrolase
MKLVRYGEPGAERPGIWLEAAGGKSARIVDVRAMAFDIEDYDARFWRTFGVERLKGLLGEPGLKTLPAQGVRLGPPVATPRQIVCLGKNYRDHAEEFDSKVPEHPVYFSKSPGSLAGPCDPIPLRPGMDCVDAEVELALVVGRRARSLRVEEALDAVAGYCTFNDVSNRALQKERLQWFFAKSADGFGPMGPWLATADEIADPQALGLRQRVNGVVLQDGHTGLMLFGIARILSDLTNVMTLEPGDVVSTGTPGGIGSARNPPILLRDGDVVECEIDGLGTQRNRVVAAAD